MNTLSIKQLSAFGACEPECRLLGEIFPDGVIKFESARLADLKAKGVSVLWGTGLLAASNVLNLAVSWYDRALLAQKPPWFDALRSLVLYPDGAKAAEQLRLRLEDRRTAPPNEAAVNLAGVGYAAAAFSARMADATDPVTCMRTMHVLAGWVAPCVAYFEKTSVDAVTEQLQKDVWEALVQHGARNP